MPDTKGKLSNKQAQFVTEYQRDMNATQAAIRAGYSAKNADKLGPRLVGKSRVAEAIEKAMKARLQRVGVYAERVLTELARVGLSDIRNLYDEDGKLKHPKDWDENTAAAVAGVEVTEEFEGKGKDKKYIGTTKKVRVFDKVRALESLGKHLGIFPSEKKEDGEGKSQDLNLTNLELSAKIIFLVRLAMERQKEIEAQKTLSGKPLDEKPKELLK
jgi:phage terminase small subunit